MNTHTCMHANRHTKQTKDTEILSETKNMDLLDKQTAAAFQQDAGEELVVEKNANTNSTQIHNPVLL